MLFTIRIHNVLKEIHYDATRNTTIFLLLFYCTYTKEPYMRKYVGKA